MKTNTENLITDLIERTRQNLNQAEMLKEHHEKELNFKPDAQSWSVLECIAHLNFYGDYYLPEIERRISQSRFPSEENFKAGLLGNYFAIIMLPGEKMKKMKTLKSTNPNGSKLNKKTLESFIFQQKKMLELLGKARKVSLNKTKTSISIASFIKLKLGDTFRVVIYHNDRHLQQAQRVLANAESAKASKIKFA
ncbi:DinB family protein [Antarcticibacterium sp. 1MA-6-2]|uniref:DinB family protein n=1 Tax=Antarcticibacterium sp. 1MA-6-2 TaxID=2908210 RepID=UPI001F2E907E|nr:DinB family protein [Antarcticibacterium sp. 1MA-6-2]UJH90385.1 DinB family protein [Antarcticibacterium sp. 1MA-6-2]